MRRLLDCGAGLPALSPLDRVLICGGRHYGDYSRILSFIRSLEDVVIISGGCSGADTLAVRAAKACGLPFRVYPAKWAKYGKSAGPIRNQSMLDMEKPSLVVAFHRDISSSRGTKDMVTRATAEGIPVIVLGSS